MIMLITFSIRFCRGLKLRALKTLKLCLKVRHWVTPFILEITLQLKIQAIYTKHHPKEKAYRRLAHATFFRLGLILSFDLS